ncbi:hypothetical protein N9971_00710 [bacterium]|nr:hypothetical protein [bacterium]
MRRVMRLVIPVVISTLAVVSIVLIGASGVANAGLLSKTYRFKTDVALQVGETTSEGVRIDTVRFTLPATVGGSHMRTGGLARAQVALSNTVDTGVKVGIAIALFDEAGRLVAVASGGSKLASLKADRQKTFELVFDDVNREAFRAVTFQISVEAR